MVSMFQSDEVAIVFNKVRIGLTRARSRISVGETVKITMNVVHAYDAKPFTGNISLSDAPKY